MKSVGDCANGFNDELRERNFNTEPAFSLRAVLLDPPARNPDSAVNLHKVLLHALSLMFSIAIRGGQC